MKPLRILITNLAMWSRSGTETYARDLALGLMKRGHQPMLYSPRLGDIAREMEAAGVEVIDNLEKLSHPPDLIHGHHNITAMVPILRFPEVPAIFVCHDSIAWHDAPPRAASIRRYVAVDRLCFNRLVQQETLPREMVSIIRNAVDLERFQPRGPLPLQPKRALLFSNHANLYTHLPAVAEACRRTGLELHVRGGGVHDACDRPEAVLGNYDLVFAKARCAMEAMAVGNAVLLCGPEGCGGMITAAEFEYFRLHNFGRHVLKNPTTADNLVKQLEEYDSREAAKVSALARTYLDLNAIVEQWIRLYQDVLAERPTASPGMPRANLEEAAQFLLLLDSVLIGIYQRDTKIQALEGELRQREEELAQQRQPQTQPQPQQVKEPARPVQDRSLPMALAKMIAWFNRT